MEWCDDFVVTWFTADNGSNLDIVSIFKEMVNLKDYIF